MKNEFNQSLILLKICKKLLAQLIKSNLTLINKLINS